MKINILPFSLILVFVFMPFSILSQVTDTVALKEVSIQKKRNIKEIIKNITKNIDKNYPKAVNHPLDINQISIRDVDTVMAFNGSINHIMPYYNQKSFGKNLPSLCQSHLRMINKKVFKEWYPPKKSKSSKYEESYLPDSTLPFFITNALNLVPISDYSFIRNYKEYAYRFENIDTKTLKLLFSPKDKTKNSRYPFKGYFIMDKDDFSISEVKYENELPYTVKSLLLISINLGSSSLVSAFNKVEKLDVFLKFKKDESLNKYLLDSLYANSSFKDSTSIKDRTTYYKHHSSTSIKRKSEAIYECENEEINLRDLGLYF